jgi:CxxC motif-containing protein (DUF1111 family)
MKNKVLLFLCFSFLLSCKKSGNNDADPIHPQDTEVYSGGKTTVFDASSKAFGQPATNLAGADLDLHKVGDANFGQKFVTAPANQFQGLGPLYNSTSCGSCHVSDGRGRPPFPGEAFNLMLFRLSVVGMDAHGAPLEVPGYGGQLQTKAAYGLRAEAQPSLIYEEIPGSYPDGSTYSLRVPHYSFSDYYTGTIASFLFSPRVGPPVFGLGLLEAIEEQTLLALADEYDLNGDGISGRPNYVWDAQMAQTRIGRFGWKANQPSLYQQTSAAYNGDMGITSPLFPTENCLNQSNCISADSNALEVSDEILKSVVFYTQTLAVPSRRNTNNPDVIEGKVLFADLGCASCHVMKMKTGILSGVPQVSNQDILPFTDLLLHDMGLNLADNRPDFRATGTEWRTPPLWGIGLTQLVSGFTFYLHDGRARSLEEAILWHGGEGEKAKQNFMQLNQKDRSRLVQFLQSL